MLFKQDKFRKILLIATILVFVIGVFYCLFEDSKAEAFNTEQIKIFPGFYTGDPPAACPPERRGEAGWQNPEAIFVQDLNEMASFEEFNIENSAYILNTSSESISSESATSTLAILEFSGFDIGGELQQTKIENIQLRLSLAARDLFESNKLIIDYYYPDRSASQSETGEQDAWQNLVEFNSEDEVSNALNGGYWPFALPVFQSWEDFENLKIRFGINPCQESETLCDFSVYLDSLWLEVNYEENLPSASLVSSLTKPSLQAPKTILSKPVAGKKSFKNNEDPVFELPQKPNLKVKKIYLIGAQGEETRVEIILQENIVKVKKPRIFKPGKYIIQIEVEEAGEIYIIEEEFMWGVLAINTNKSIYLPNEQAYLQMGALRDDGYTLCDANLRLEITNPNKQISYPQVEKSGLCQGNNVVDVPDYFAYYIVSTTGTYQMKLINLDNQYEIIDSFEVWESVPFDIERIGPTRIYPPAVYQVKLKIKANQDFTGQAIESMPAGFVVITDETAEVVVQDDTKKIIWSVNWQAGEYYELIYQFDAPDISPYLYLLGPLEIHD